MKRFYSDIHSPYDTMWCDKNKYYDRCPVCGKKFKEGEKRITMYAYGSARDYCRLPNVGNYHEKCYKIAKNAYDDACEKTRSTVSAMIISMLNKPKPKKGEEDDDEELDEDENKD